ncbi:LAMI_0G07228g1_1 [Lachancea mirantina]|uniref:malate dehydrogenase n=1 Tax=Lachancea mirantina TaxID=1230905 RepID=A0A1G4K9J3_9SACH|nr:LAMI_0G07228g1_1 [Lachancea mirantina]
MPHNTQEQEPLKVAVLGAAGGIGQSLSLLLKTWLGPVAAAAAGAAAPAAAPRTGVIKIAMYDVNRDAVRGAAADLSHIDTPVAVSAHAGDDIGDALRGAELVVIPAGVPRRPGMTRDDLFAVNARIVATLADAIAAHCDLSRTFVLLISNPVNSLVPVLQERLVHASGRSPHDVAQRVFGLTQLDAVRASTFLHEAVPQWTPEMPSVPVVGGHSGETIVPLFSLATRAADTITAEARERLVHRVQYGGDEVVEAKNGAGSATLSMAYAAARITCKFADLLLGLVPELHDTLYVRVRVPGQLLAPGAQDLLETLAGITAGGNGAAGTAGTAAGTVAYFSVPITVGTRGIVSVDALPLQRADEFERKALAVCLGQLGGNIKKGQNFVANLGGSPAATARTSTV